MITYNFTLNNAIIICIMNEEKKELFAKISANLQAAMKSKDELRLSVLRMIKSKIIYVNARGDMPDNEIIKIISKYAKELKESIEEFKKVGRNDIAEKTLEELKIVEEYLPKQLSEAEIKALVQAAATTLGATSIKEMGKVMQEVLKNNPGIDGKLVSQFVREILK